ncbi:MAG: hypothetical protein QOG09_1834 [Solirubrobacterales bacterium]|nr:hypothetical protein [Solirubrobacterales bacterium]
MSTVPSLRRPKRTIVPHGGDNPLPVDAAVAMQRIERLCSFAGRYPGTDAERRAANDLAGQLRGAGRRVEIEPTHVHPQWALVHAAHLALAIAGSLVAIASPAAGFVLVLLTATSLYLDLNSRLYLLRRLFFRRASQNVLGRGRRPEAPARIVISAHYDAGRTGAVYGERATRIAARLPRAARVVLAPMRIVFWSLALLVPLLGARLAGIDASWLAAIQLVPTVVLIVAFVALLDIALSPVVTGANDNASGVAVAMALEEALAEEPPSQLDVWLLLTGGHECLGEGMRSFVREHADELAEAPTYFLVLDAVGSGDVHYATSEGLAVSYQLDLRLAQICEAIATADRESENRFRAVATASGSLTDALPASQAGHPAIALVGAAGPGLPPPHHHSRSDTPDRIDPGALERFHDFALELVRQIDRDTDRRLG